MEVEQGIKLLEQARYGMKLYDILSRRVCEEYQITRTELDVLAFLKNNPGRDTARDIIELRMLPKANVSQAVESLIQKKYLARQTDERDRRRIHLTIQPLAEDTVTAVLKMQQETQEIRFQGFSPEERQLYSEMVSRIYKNSKGAIDDMKERRQ